MAWLAIGALLLLLATPGGRGKAALRLDPPAAAALAAFAAAAWLALSVYPPGRVAPVALAWAAGFGLLRLARAPAARQMARWALLTLGIASSLFALLGPADGLF